MKTVQTIANATAFLITIVINYLASTGVFAGNTMATISERYPNLFTPAGYAFSIWGLIYLGLLGFIGQSIWHLVNKKRDIWGERIGWWFVISCLANSLWVIAWLHDQLILSLALMGTLMLSLIKIVRNTRMELDHHPWPNYLFVFWPFAAYLGWITVAAVANAATWLTKIRWNGWGVDEITWTLVMIIVASGLHVYLIWSRNLRESAAVAIWGIVAIWINNSTSGFDSIIAYGCLLGSLLILANIIAHAWTHQFTRRQS